MSQSKRLGLWPCRLSAPLGSQYVESVWRGVGLSVEVKQFWRENILVGRMFLDELLEKHALLAGNQRFRQPPAASRWSAAKKLKCHTSDSPSGVKAGNA